MADLPVHLCHEAGGAWVDGEPCRMDAAVHGERCRFHRPGLSGAIGCAILAELLDPMTTRVVEAGTGPPSLVEREAVKRLLSVGKLWHPGSSSDFPPPDVETMLTKVRVYAATLRVLWDVASRPGTDEIARLAELLRHRLAVLHDDLGSYLAQVIQMAMHKPYCETAGNLCPFPTRRHHDECERPFDAATGRDTCECPVLLEWEWRERQVTRGDV